MVGQLVIGKDFRFFYQPPIGRIVTDMIELPTESQRPYAGQFVNLGSSYPANGWVVKETKVFSDKIGRAHVYGI